MKRDCKKGKVCATKKIGNNIVLMVNDRCLNADTFWFTLFHEIGHILNGDLGISFEKEAEEKADKFAEDSLIPPVAYANFVQQKNFDKIAIKEFAKKINRDPSIVLGRLQNDHHVRYDDNSLNSLRVKYKIQRAESL